MKNLKYIYELYIPKIIRNKNKIKYNLSKETIFGNLNYSMSKEILKAKNKKFDYLNTNRPARLKNYRESKLLPLLRMKNS